MSPSNPLPIGCAARYAEVERRADELLESFLNGNRKVVLEELESMEPRAAFAVLARMSVFLPTPEVGNFVNFFMEMA